MINKTLGNTPQGTSHTINPFRFRVTFQIESTANRCRADETCAIFALLSDLTDFSQWFVVSAGVEPARTYKGFNMATLNLMPSHFETRLTNSATIP